MKKNVVRYFISCLIVLSAVSILSCATSAVLGGKSFNYQAVSEIKKNESTKHDIQKIFGEPFKTREAESGDVWSYYMSEVKVFSNPTHSLDVYFNKSGIVTDYVYSEGEAKF